jgi:hypothetical protein
MAHLASEAFADIFDNDQLDSFQSPSFRRRYRKNLKRKLGLELRREASEPDWVLIRQYFDRLEQDFRALGYEPDLRRIKSLAELESEQHAVLTTLLESGQIGNLLPFDKTVDPRLAYRLWSELGEKGYPSSVVLTLWELIFQSPEGKRVRNDSALWKLLGIDPTSDPEPENFTKKLMVMLLGLGGLAPTYNFSGEPLRMEELLRFLVRWHLPYIALGPHPWARQPDPLDYPLAGRGAEVDSKTLDLKIDVEVALDELPAAQRRAMDICLEATSTGTRIKELCKSDKDYQAVRQNLRLARKKLKKALMA